MKYAKIQKAIDSGLLSSYMCKIVSPPTKDDVVGFASEKSITLNEDHIQLLIEWGGSDLDEIRINNLQNVKTEGNLIFFANDYNGYLFAYDTSGNVYATDTDGGKKSKLVNSIYDFINDFLFGEEGIEFYGGDWVSELKQHALA